MLRENARDARLTNAAARLENPVATVEQLEQDLDELQRIAEKQRQEIDQACRTLIRQRELQLQLLERLNVRSATMTVDGLICGSTTAFANLLRSTPQHLRAQSILNCFESAAQNQLLALCRECIKGRMDASLDSVLVLPGTERIRARITLTLLPGWALADQQSAPELLVVLAPPLDATDLDRMSSQNPTGRHAVDSVPIPEQPQGQGESIAWIVGGLAHDFNNALTAVSCNLSMALMDTPEGSPVVATLKDAAQAVGQAASVTRQLLEFSRRQPVQRCPARVSALIEQLQPSLARLAGEEIAIVSRHATDSGVIEVDPRQFEIVLQNLIVNARDAMQGGGSLTIETSNVVLAQKYNATRPALTPGNYVAVRITDSGSGMTKETLARLFEPFFTTKSRGRAKGLGLAACHTIVKQSSGGIEVGSALGQGTSVTVYWPRVLDVERAPLAVHVRANPDGGPETILLVEDDATLRGLGMRILSRLGYRVLSAANGIEALEVAANHPGRIDLLFTDIVMPGMSGRELALRLREFRPEIKVLYTSGYTERVFDDEPKRDRSPFDYLGKPYRPETLASRITSMLHAH